MQTYLKTKPVWVQLLIFLGIAFGSFFIASAVGVRVLSKMTGIGFFQMQDFKGWEASNPAMLTFIRGMILLQFLFLFTLPSLLFSYLSDPQPARYLGLRPPHKSLYWALGLLAIVVAYPFVEYLAFLNQKLPVAESTGKWMKQLEEQAAKQIGFMLRDRSPLELVKNLVFIALFAGVGEELFFRGVLQRMFIRLTRNPWMGIVLTAAIFSGIHFQFYGFFPRFFLGILLGAFYWYSGSLWVAILAHFLYDAAVITVIYFNPQMLAAPEAQLIEGGQWALLAGAMISLALTFVILRKMQADSLTAYEAVYNDDFPKRDDRSSF